MAIKNYYDLLGVQPTASQDDIKQAFRKLSMKFHPDKNEGDTFLMEMFKSINEANEVLSNPDKRKEYDQRLEQVVVIANTNTNTSTTTAYEVYPSTHDQERVYTLWNQYLEKKKKADEAYDYMVRANQLDVPRYITAKKVLSSLLVLLLVWFFLKPVANSTAIRSGSITTEWRAVRHTDIYSKPTIKAKVIGELTGSEQLQALEETKYFIKVEFIHNSGVLTTGYVLKSSLRSE